MGEPPNDQHLIQRVLDGDRDAFRGIVYRHGLMLRSYLSSQLYHRDEADDLAQEVLIVALQKLDTFETGRDFGAWLRGIARHKLHNHFRSIRRRNDAMERFFAEVHETIAPEMEQAAKNETRYSIEALLCCIDKLPDKLRKVVRAGLEGRHAQELAQELETTRGAVYNLHYRSNQLLRDCVEKELAEPA